MHLNWSRDTLIFPIIPSNIWQSAAFPYIKEARKVVKLENKNLFFNSAFLILTVSTNDFHRTNLFCFLFPRYQAPTSNVAPSFCIKIPHNPQFLDSLRRRSDARNVSFWMSLRSVDKPKLSCNTPSTQHYSFFKKLPPFCPKIFKDWLC